MNGSWNHRSPTHHKPLPNPQLQPNKKSKAHIITNSLGPKLGTPLIFNMVYLAQTQQLNHLGVEDAHHHGGPTGPKHPEMPWIFGSFRSIDPIHPQRNPLHSWIGYLIWELKKSCPKTHWETQIIDSQTAQAWPNFLVSIWASTPTWQVGGSHVQHSAWGATLSAMPVVSFEVGRSRLVALKLAGWYRALQVKMLLSRAICVDFLVYIYIYIMRHKNEGWLMIWKPKWQMISRWNCLETIIYTIATWF